MIMIAIQQATYLALIRQQKFVVSSEFFVVFFASIVDALLLIKSPPPLLFFVFFYDYFLFFFFFIFSIAPKQSVRSKRTDRFYSDDPAKTVKKRFVIRVTSAKSDGFAVTSRAAFDRSPVVAYRNPKGLFLVFPVRLICN